MSVARTGKGFGFTTIELIVVILLLGILSVTVLPKFMSNDGIDEIVFRDRLISLLRLQQTRAMQQTTQSCHRVLVVAERFGIPFSGGLPTCSSNTLPTDFVSLSGAYTTEHYGLSVAEVANSNVIFSTHDIYFNPLGCAGASVNSQCGQGSITIQISGESTQQVCIESQGYIHAGSCDS